MLLDKQNYQSGDTIHGSFILRNERSESVPSIYYKIILGSNFEISGNAEAIYDTKTSDPFFLYPGESKTIEFKYTLPTGIAGKHLGIIISSFLKNGMPTGWSFPISFNVEGEFSYVMALDPKLITDTGEFNPEEGPTLHKDKNIKYQVTLSNPSSKQITLTPKIDIYKRVVLSPALKSYSEKNIILNPKEKKQVTFQLPNFDYKTNVYAGTITFVNSRGERQGTIATFRYVVLGKTIIIENISSSHTNIQKNALSTIRVDYSKPLIDTFTFERIDIGTSTLKVKVFNEQGGVVAEGKETIDFTSPTKNKIFTLKAKEQAQALYVEANILEGETIIGEYSNMLSPDYKIRAEESKKVPQSQKIRLNQLLFVIGITLLMGLITIIFRRKREATLLLFFGITSIFTLTVAAYITYAQQTSPVNFYSISATPNPTSFGGQSFLDWNAQNATTCTLSGGGYNNLDITNKREIHGNCYGGGGGG
ncbi:MAG: hypothetical protein AAB611_03895, partial [Patescibacteria group bacterium]